MSIIASDKCPNCGHLEIPENNRVECGNCGAIHVTDKDETKSFPCLTCATIIHYENVEFKLWEYNTQEKALKDIEPEMEQFREQVCHSYEMKSIEEYDDGYIIIVHVGKLTYEIYYSDINESMYYDRYTRKQN